MENFQQPKASLKPQVLEEDAAFFKNKLLDAERYIEEIDHINLTNGQILSQQNEEVRQLTVRATSLENALKNAEKTKNALSEELASQKDLNSRLNDTASKQISPT